MKRFYKWTVPVAIALGLLGIVGILVPKTLTHSSARPGETALLSEPGATFAVTERELRKNVTVIAYGDMRFTDPANHEAADPMAREALVVRIASAYFSAPSR